MLGVHASEETAQADSAAVATKDAAATTSALSKQVGAKRSRRIELYLSCTPERAIP
jgi:hypothetical protein